MSKDFLIVVITSPEYWEGEADCLEELLQAGVEKLHIRKLRPAEPKLGSPARSTDHQLVSPPLPAAMSSLDDGTVVLLERLAPRWSSRLVLHGGKDVGELAQRYGVPQVHGHWEHPWEGAMDIRLSTSVHSWDEVREIPVGRLEYVFLSPLFDSISKPGYRAGAGLLHRPEGIDPCPLIGLGGIDQHTIGQVMDHGWDGAAILGHIWENPAQAVIKFKALTEIVDNHGRPSAKSIGSSRI